MYKRQPLIFTSIGGVFSERGGVVNVGLEGIMVMGAFSGVVFNLEFAEQFGAATPWLSLLVAGLVGGLFSIIHACLLYTSNWWRLNNRYPEKTRGSKRQVKDGGSVWQL